MWRLPLALLFPTVGALASAPPQCSATLVCGTRTSTNKQPTTVRTLRISRWMSTRMQGSSAVVGSAGAAVSGSSQLMRFWRIDRVTLQFQRGKPRLGCLCTRRARRLAPSAQFVVHRSSHLLTGHPKVATRRKCAIFEQRWPSRAPWRLPLWHPVPILANSTQLMETFTFQSLASCATLIVYHLASDFIFVLGTVLWSSRS